MLGREHAKMPTEHSESNALVEMRKHLAKIKPGALHEKLVSSHKPGPTR